jgi:thiamine monophosphate kinase
MKRPKVAQVVLTDEDFELLRTIAKREQRTVSAMVRYIVVKALTELEATEPKP